MIDGTESFYHLRDHFEFTTQGDQLRHALHGVGVLLFDATRGDRAIVRRGGASLGQGLEQHVPLLLQADEVGELRDQELAERRHTARRVARDEVAFAVGEYLPGFHPHEDYRRMYASRRDLGGGVTLSQIHEIVIDGGRTCW